MHASTDRKSTRLNSSHTVIYTLSLHDALPICIFFQLERRSGQVREIKQLLSGRALRLAGGAHARLHRSEEHTSELQSHSDLHSFPTRRSSDLHFLSTGTSIRSSSRNKAASVRSCAPPRGRRSCTPP